MIFEKMDRESKNFHAQLLLVAVAISLTAAIVVGIVYWCCIKQIFKTDCFIDLHHQHSARHTILHHLNCQS